MSARVLAFERDEALLDRFVALPRAIYDGCPFFAPPPCGAERAQLSAGSPFLRHGRLRCFLALDEAGRACGRVASMINRDLKHPTLRIGHVGFFEAVDRYDVAANLLDHAVEDLRREGCDAVWGPLNFSTLHGYRFLTKGFDVPAFYGDVYNPPHYPGFFERYGFRTLRRYTTAVTDRPAEIRHRYARSRSGLAAKGYSVRNVDTDRFDEEMLLLHALVMDIFSDNFAFAPLGPDEFLGIYDRYRGKIAPDHLRFVHDPAGAPVAFLLCIPDYAGRLPGAMITKTLGVSRSARGLGVSEALYHDAMLHHMARGCDRLISPLRILGNLSERFGGEETFSIVKEYQLYSYSLV